MLVSRVLVMVRARRFLYRVACSSRAPDRVSPSTNYYSAGQHAGVNTILNVALILFLDRVNNEESD